MEKKKPLSKMRLKILGSSSAGNCYILENDQEALIVECGVKLLPIKKALEFKLNKVVGCVISHEHLDHCKGVMELAAAGIDIYSSVGTISAMCNGGHNHHRFHPVLSDVEFKIGGFTVKPFDVRHDAAEPLNFLIHHEQTGNVLFVTDTYYVPYTFRNLNNILVEANYSQAILDKRMDDGKTQEFLRNRIWKSHMNLETCKKMLKANNLSQVNNIILIHLSDGNSDAEDFQQQVTELTGKTVHVAGAGMIIENFNKAPF
jgi:phosphoribosyl 1,2-cyclic phosphodiesterase